MIFSHLVRMLFSTYLVLITSVVVVWCIGMPPSHGTGTGRTDTNVMEQFRERVRQSEEKAKHYKDPQDSSNLTPIPEVVFDKEATPYIMLNVGGITPVDGWFNVNAQFDPLHPGNRRVEDPAARTDTIIRDMDRLEGFPDGSVSVVYSSHTLEHASSSNGEVQRTLREWRRVLRPGGMLMVAVPDFEMLSRLFLRKSYFEALHWSIVSIMFGAQRDTYDFHVSAFDERILRGMLREAGFCSIERVKELNMFPHDHDASTYEFITIPISLNMVARPCVPEGAATDGFFIQHHATPYVPINDDDIPEYDEEKDRFYTIVRSFGDNQKVRMYHEDWEYAGPREGSRGQGK